MTLRVLVTAGASGIGLEIARAFVSSGARVFICDIDAAALGRAATELPGVETSVCDVGDRTAIVAMVAEAAARLGGIDVLVNNAGIDGPTKPMHELDPADWDAVLRIKPDGGLRRHAQGHPASDPIGQRCDHQYVIGRNATNGCVLGRMG